MLTSIFIILVLIFILIIIIILAMILAAALFRPPSLCLLGLLRELLLLSAAPLLLPQLADAVLVLCNRVPEALPDDDIRVLLGAGGGEVLILLGVILRGRLILIFIFTMIMSTIIF